MALRVLLADESSTIKRVIQLALQDYGVDVKAVHSGVDVLEVAKTYKPDIIFADVLLQKRNGYEAASELKASNELRYTPIILMWSSFMELDEAAFQKSGANARLEKPFDVEALRKLVHDLVPRTLKQSLGTHLEFPPTITAELKSEAASSQPTKASAATLAKPVGVSVTTPPAAKTPAKPPVAPPEANPVSIFSAPPTAGAFSLEDDVDDTPNDFRFSELSQPAAPIPAPAEDDEQLDDENWSHQDLSQFKLDLQPLKIEGEDLMINFEVEHGSIEGEKLITSGVNQPKTGSPEPARITTSDKSNARQPATNIPVADSTTLDPNRSAIFSEPPLERSRVDAIALPPDYANDNSEPNVISSFEDFEKPSSYNTKPLVPFQQLSAEQLEKLIRAQSKEIIEAVVRKIVPDIATRMIREELDRLLAEGQR